MMNNPGQIFAGVIQKEFREYLKKALKPNPDHERFVDATAGSFAIVKCALEAGWDPSKIFASDVSLYSAVLGYIASGQKIEDLGVMINAPELGFSDGIETDPAKILFAIKYLNMSADNPYTRGFRREMLIKKDKHLEAMALKLSDFESKYKGINYQSRCMFETVEEASKHPWLVHLDVPGTKTGYSKMFDTGGRIIWNEPQFHLFDPKTDKDILIGKLASGKGVAFIRQFREMDEYKAQFLVAAFDAGKGNRDYYLCTKPDYAAKVAGKIAFVKPQTNVEAMKIKLFGDDDVITPQSQITFRVIKREQALYYRDLFAHRLGVTRSEIYLAMLIDGKLTSVSGFHLTDWIRKREDYIFETFGFSCRPKKYPRINKLHMMCLTCQETRDFIKSRYTKVVNPLTRFRTVCLTRHHEQKGNRGVLNLVGRELMKNGMFKIQYEIDFRPWGWQEALNKWYSKEVSSVVGKEADQ